MSTLRIKRRPGLSRKAVKSVKRPDYMGHPSPGILFVVDPVVGHEDDEEAPRVSQPLPGRQLEFLTQYCEKHRIPRGRAAIVACAPPVPREVWDSQKKLGAHLKEHRAAFTANVISAKPKLIVALGKSAASQTLNRAVQITKARGSPVANDEFGATVFPSLGVAHVIRIPEAEKIFDADFATIKKIVEADFELDYQDEIKRDYRWVEDLEFMIDRIKVSKGPFWLSVDTEYEGGEWYQPSSRLLTLQLCDGPGRAYAVPIDYNHKNHLAAPNLKLKAKLVKQLKTILEHPKVKVFGQMFKGDFMMIRAKLGIEVANYEDDTICLAHAVDENILNKNLDELTRLFVPALSGYADEFNRDPIHEKKTRMSKVPPAKMLMYGCGDVDACWRVREATLEILNKDKKALRCHQRVVMPAMRAFCDVEEHGFCIDKKALQAFEKELRKHQAAEYDRLLAMVPKSIRDAYVIDKIDKKTGKVIKKGSITRPVFLLQMLFKHKDGLRLKPRVFTKSTAKLKDVTQRVPSVSGKQHLAYFKEYHPFVDGIMEYIKNEKLLGTYVGTEDGDTIKGFYKYIFDGRIRPSYLLHRAVTGRTASANPNGQNFPKRGKLAKKYREIFVAPPGYVLLEVDFSQIELRVAAIMANEPTMLRLYREGADIHAATAAAVMGITLEQFYKLPKETRDLKRFQAKAVNFGFLYGMGWRKFITYAKTEYGIEFTEEEAQNIRTAFFKLYRNLKPWHNQVEEFVKQHGFVRTFDGRVRHLPSVWSPDDGISHSAIRQAINSPVQAFGSDLGLMAVALINDNVSRDLVRPIGFIHDAIVCIAPEAKAKEAAAAIKYWMEHIPLEQWFGFKPPIPIIAEAEVGKNLSSMIEISDEMFANEELVSYYDIQMAEYEAAMGKWRKDTAEARKNGKRPPDQPKRPVRPPIAQPRRKAILRPRPKPAFKPRPKPVIKRRA